MLPGDQPIGSAAGSRRDDEPGNGSHRSQVQAAEAGSLPADEGTGTAGSRDAGDDAAEKAAGPEAARAEAGPQVGPDSARTGRPSGPGRLSTIGGVRGLAGLWARPGRRPRETLTGPESPPGEDGSGPAASPDGGRAAAAARSWLAWLTTAPAIIITAWLLAGVPLLLAGVFLPVPVLLISVPLAALLLTGALRRVPASWPPGRPAARGGGSWLAWFGLAGTLTVAAGFTLWQFGVNSESVIVLRDPGAYLQTGYWIAQHGALPIPQALSAFGGPHSGLSFASTGFAAQGSSVVPALMSGLPLLLAGAFWTHGLSAAAALSPILGGLAVLSFGGLVARLVGVRWAPAGALVLALTLPEQYTSRAPFAEPAVQILLFGGLCLVIDALSMAVAPADGAPAQTLPMRAPWRTRSAAGRWLASRRWSRWAGSHRWVSRLSAHRWASRLSARELLAGLGGLALGLTTIMLADALTWLLAAIPFGIVWLWRERARGIAFCMGLVIGTGYGLAGGYLLAGPAMALLRPPPALIGLAAVVLVAATLAVIELLASGPVRRRLTGLLASRPLRWIPGLCALLAVGVLIMLAARPYLQTVTDQPSPGVAGFVAALQRMQHLPVRPDRTYAEDTLYWVIWYVGATTVLLGGFGLALLARRCARSLLTWQDEDGTARAWALPMLLAGWAAAVVLWSPDTTPDQPWASRRLVPVVLPGLIACAIWAAAWLADWAREHGAAPVTTAVVGTCCVAALLVPTAITTFGLGLTHTGPGGGLRAAANGLALRRTGPGEVAAEQRLCAALGPRATVVIVDGALAAQFSQLIRGMCDVPVASMAGQPASAVGTVLQGIVRAGRRPVLLGSTPAQLTAFGLHPVRVVQLSTATDPAQLTQPPAAPVPARYVIWLSAPGAPGAGA